MSESPETDGPQPRLLLGTRFGTFEADQSSVLSFPDGLPGFEHVRRFVVLNANPTAPLQCLAAVDAPDVAFLAVDPRLVDPAYRCAIEPADLTRLDADGSTPLLWLALISIDERDDLTVNLLAPVVINPARMVGRQVLPRSSPYSVRHRLSLA